ncbi:MAG: redox-sensing transcriptional repressor Rex [Clostridiales bacterium]|nr:MAG: redox-sensing transcriptional repressor Rex [Clostridiales bacterium]
MNKQNGEIYLTVQTLGRLPYYLQYLHGASLRGETSVSASALAANLKLNDVLVRKDLSLISTSKGKPKSGFNVQELISNIEDCLGYNNTMDAVLVGVGSQGKALLGSSEFQKYGLNIIAAFDIDEDIVGRVFSGKQVFPLDKVLPLCERLHVHIGIITVPAEFAQNIADLLISCGIKALWNFAPVKLDVPSDVIVQNENLAASLAILSQHLREELSGN